MYFNQYGQPDMIGAYKSPYQPQNAFQSQPTSLPYQQQKPATSDFKWVQGEAGAKAYLVAPNNTVTLWDSESQKIYIKSADMSGMPTMRVLEYTENAQSVPNVLGNALKSDFDDLGDKFVGIEQFDELRAKYEELDRAVKAMKKRGKGEE